MSAPVIARPAAATTRAFVKGASGPKSGQLSRPPSKAQDGTQQRRPNSGGFKRPNSLPRLDAQGKPLPFKKKPDEPRKPYVHSRLYGIPPPPRVQVAERGIHLNPQIQTWKPRSPERLQTLLNPESAMFRGSLPMMQPDLNILSKDWERLREVEALSNPGYLRTADGVMSPLDRAKHALSRNAAFTRKQALACVRKVEELIGPSPTSATPKSAS